MRHDTDPTNMAVKMPELELKKGTIRPLAYEKFPSLLSGKPKTLINLRVVNPKFYHSTSFVDKFRPPTQLIIPEEGAPAYEIYDFHHWDVYNNGTCRGR